MGDLNRLMETEIIETPLTRVEQPSEVGQLIQLALQAGQNPTELYAILREERAARAVKAFALAKHEFIGACPRIVETKQAGDLTKAGSKFTFKYADMCDILDQTLPLLRRLGFSWGFTLVVLADGKQYQRCNLTHSDGHTEPADVPYMPDADGHMNAIQRIGSGLTYSQRYSLLAALGLPTGPPSANTNLATITVSQAAVLDALIAEVGAVRGTPINVAAFLSIFKVKELSELPASRYAEAVEKLGSKKPKTEDKKNERVQ